MFLRIDMPTTKFKLGFETDEPDIDLEKFQKSLPHTFKVYHENNGIYISVETARDEDENAKYLVERELDRHFFLTCVKISSEMVLRRVQSSLVMCYRIHGDLPENITPQKWNYDLPIMLKLWSIAADLRNEFRLQILYYFHIIELTYPSKDSYPDYTDHTTPPHPLTECKFIRHLVAHAGEIGGIQLKLYCKYLDMPEVMFDLTDSRYQSILLSKLILLEEQAKKAIQKYIYPNA